MPSFRRITSDFAGVFCQLIEHYIIHDNAEMDAVWCETTTPSFPRKRESSLSNNLRVADKAVFTVLSHCVRVFTCLDSRFRGNDDCFNVYVMNYVKINNFRH